MAGTRNAEGYCDPTAYFAMRNVEKSERRRAMNFKRGDIYYVERSIYTGCEQRAGRPAIIVSNDKNNEFSSTVEVVYLTTQPKKNLPTHVVIRSVARESIAICEQITTVAVERIGSYNGHVTDAEMANLEIAMMISLDMQTGEAKKKIVEVDEEVLVEADKKAPVQMLLPNAGLLEELAVTKAKCEMLQIMYDNLLSRVLSKTV